MGFFDEVNTAKCSRCGGTGHMPFAVWQGRCFKCGGSGRMAIVPKGQGPKVKKLKQPLVELKDAKPGDLVKIEGTAAILEAVFWRHFGNAGMYGNADNQVCQLRRVVDDKISSSITRTVYHLPEIPRAFSITRDAEGNEIRTPASVNVDVPKSAHLTRAELDAEGNWIIPVEAEETQTA